MLECSKTLRVLNVKRTVSDVFVFATYLYVLSEWRLSLHNESNWRLQSVASVADMDDLGGRPDYVVVCVISQAITLVMLGRKPY